MVLVYLLGGMEIDHWIRKAARRQFGENRTEFPGQACAASVPHHKEYSSLSYHVHTMDMIVGVGVSQKSDRPTK
jgi:hypothetical protein